MTYSLAEQMMGMLPKYYEDALAAIAIIEREAAELAFASGQLDEAFRQFFLETATWGLSRWEEACGITASGSKPLDQRRSLIKSRLRGAGTVTLAVIRSVVDSFENGEISVEEKFGDWKVVVTFIGKRGVPPNLADVKSAVREILPAHLLLEFQFTYLRWEELDAAGLDWNALERLGFSWDALEVWNPVEGK
ncbi:putative phage tail protein [Paenibacillus sp. FSL W8-1187]|uniref:putative phage tail protein n=1 Tax=unclassified Paenibacillus TaxID=185978 RepID=UPI00129B72D3|nr:putative phage tail protein [Paenibacillus sp. B01]QGG55965.1 DUF2313 domain-containing protein [Paenibacillus sp. B01]